MSEMVKELMEDFAEVKKLVKESKLTSFKIAMAAALLGIIFFTIWDVLGYILIPISKFLNII